MKQIFYLLVPFEEVKDIFPYARVLPDGRAVLELARIKQLRGIHGIEVVTSHEVELLMSGQTTGESGATEDGDGAVAENLAVESAENESENDTAEEPQEDAAEPDAGEQGTEPAEEPGEEEPSEAEEVAVDDALDEEINEGLNNEEGKED